MRYAWRVPRWGNVIASRMPFLIQRRTVVSSTRNCLATSRTVSRSASSCTTLTSFWSCTKVTFSPLFSEDVSDYHHTTYLTITTNNLFFGNSSVKIVVHENNMPGIRYTLGTMNVTCCSFRLLTNRQSLTCCDLHV